jgi:hypothetical protein
MAVKRRRASKVSATSVSPRGLVFSSLASGRWPAWFWVLAPQDAWRCSPQLGVARSHTGAWVGGAACVQPRPRPYDRAIAPYRRPSDPRAL